MSLETDTADGPAETAGIQVSAVTSASNLFGTRHDGSVFDNTGSMTEGDFDQLLLWCGNRKASDITIQTDEHVMALIGGKLVPVTRRPVRAGEIDMIVRYLYGDHGPGMLKAAHDLDPGHEVRMAREDGGLKRYRTNITAGRVPGADGAQITIRTLPKEPYRLEELGIEESIVRNVRPSTGMVLVTGPTGSGKSTLLSSMIRYIVEQPEANAKVLEYSHPIEYVYDTVIKPSSSIWQTEVGKHLVPYSEAGNVRNTSFFAHAVRNALRRNPDIILIGETRDEETMRATTEAALTGHLVYSTLHVTGVPASLRRIVQFFPGDQGVSAAIDAMESLKMVVTQRLFPRLGGGRVALREFMIFDDRTRAQFMKKSPEQWPDMARRMMDEKKVESQKMTAAAWTALEAGLIDDEVYESIVVNERNLR